MSYTSVGYIFFMFAVAIIFYLCQNQFQWIVLLIANMSFYLMLDYKMCPFFGATILMTYIGALWIDKAENNIVLKRIVFVSILFVNMGILLLFKTEVMTIFMEAINSPIYMIAPIGLSFYTFQLAGYLIDVYWGVVKAEKNLGKYMLFASFFPQIISGPISRYGNLRPQFDSIKHLNPEMLYGGIERILWGTFKKLVVADRAALFVNEVYGKPSVYRGSYAMIATVLFVVQLYCDFSGCIDIALGSAEVFQIKLPENFEQPFFSRSISEFWRRWHITLGAWFKDYLFYPLLKSNLLFKCQTCLKEKWGKKKARNASTYIGMFFLWLSIGIWHGAEWHYIIGAGLIYWFIVVGGNILQPFTQWLVKILRINVKCKSYEIFEMLRTIFLFSFAIVFWRSPNIHTALYILKGIFTYYNPWIFFDEKIYNVALNRQEFTILLFGIFVTGVVEYWQQKGSVRRQLLHQNKVCRIGLYAALTILIIIFGQYGSGFDTTLFIYGQF